MKKILMLIATLLVILFSANAVNADTFFINHTGNVTAGNTTDVTIQVHNSTGGIITDYIGYVLLETTAEDSDTTSWTINSGNGTLEEWDGSGIWKYEFDSTDNGSVILNFVDTKAETLTIDASSAGMTTYTSANLVVSAGTINHFDVSHDGYGVVGSQETVTITAQDTYNNTDTNYTGDVFLNTTGTNANITWTPGVHLSFSGEGSQTVTISSNTVQTFKIIAEDVTGTNGTSENITFDNPTITVNQSNGDVGTQITVTGNGFDSEVSVAVTLGTATNTTITDTNGSLTAILTIPQVANGTYNITAGTAVTPFTINLTDLGFELTEADTNILIDAETSGTATFDVSLLGNNQLNITDISVTDLTGTSGENYTINNITFSPSTFELSWTGTQIVTTTINLNGTPIQGTYTGIITLTDSSGVTKDTNLTVDLLQGTYDLVIPSTASITGTTEETLKTTSVIITNNGTLDLTEINLTYSSSDSSNGLVTFDTNNFDLSAGTSKTVIVTGDITTLTEDTYTGTIAVTSNEGENDNVALTITVTDAPEDVLIIHDVDSNEENNLVDGETLDSIQAGKTLTLDIEVENLENFDLEDVLVTVTIKDIDDNDDLEEEYDIGNVRDGDRESSDFSFDIPWELTDDTYEMLIEVTGEDDDGEEYTDEITITLDVERNTHDIAISELDLGIDTLKCTRSTTLTIDMTNVGERDEDEIVLSVKNSALGLNIVREGIEIDSAETDTETITINLEDEDVTAGEYNIVVKTYPDENDYDDGDETDYQTISLEVEDCSSTTTTATTTTTDTTITTVPVTNTDIPTTTEISFTESTGYGVALILGNIVLVIIIIFMIMKIFTINKKY